MKISALIKAILFAVFATTITPAAWGLDGLQTGMKAPFFKLTELRGREIGLADHGDANVTVVVFWSTWSDHSPPLLDRLEKLYRKLKKEKLNVLAVNVEKQLVDPEDLAEIKKTVARLGLTFPVLMDDGLKVFRSYGVVAVPSTVVVDREGTIRGEMAAYPLAQREEILELIEAMAEKREIAKAEVKSGYEPVPRAVRYYNLARAMAGRGMVDEVEDNLKKSIATDPNFVLPLLLASKFYRERGETEEAIEYQGNRVVTATFKADRQRYVGEAAALIDKALKVAPQSGAVLTEAALVRLAEGKTAAAKEALAKAIQNDASYTPARYYMAALLVRDGKAKEGEKEFQEAVRLNPLDYQAYYAIARAYDDTKSDKKAIEAYKKVYQMLYRERELFPYSYGR